MSKFTLRNDGILDPEGKYLNPVNGLPYSKHYKNFAISPKVDEKGWSQLKAYEDRFEILKKIHSKSILLVSLPTGTGKTVIVPRLLYHYYGYEKKIMVTTPRKQTTSSAGEFAAICFDVPLFHLGDDGKEIVDKTIEKGKENRYPTGNKFVGYKHGSSKEYADNTTKLLFTTDGTVKTMITTGDQDLAEYGGIVIDEVHERSVSIDVVISLVMDILNRRKDFKIIFMSATMDLNIFTEYFKRLGQGNNYEIYTVKVPKTTYDIKFIYNEKVIAKNANKIVDEVYNKIDKIMLELDKSNDIGDILAFVSSDSETNKLKTKINKTITRYSENNRPYVIAMSGTTSDDEMSRAKTAGALKNINPTKDAPKGYKRKIMIATPMAESSITFSDPLKYVIDGGFAYKIYYDADKYCYISGKQYVTQASIKQRCGRTGRTCAGTCVQLYTEKEYNTFLEFLKPEILSEDFTQELLNIMKLPINERQITKSLSFVQNMLEPLENYKSFVKVGYNNIKEMDFIDEFGKMTILGELCSEFNTFDIKIAKMIIGSYFFNCLEYSIIMGAILHTCTSFGDIFKQLSDDDKKDKAKVKAHEDNIKKFIRKEGDHISLLIIYNYFLSHNSSYEFAEKYGLDYKLLTKIQTAHIELNEAVITQDIRTRISMVNKFVYVNNQFKTTPQMIARGGSTNLFENDLTKLLKKYKTYKTKTYKTKTYKKNKNKYNKYKLNNVSRNNYKRYLQNTKTNTTLFNRTHYYGGRIISKNDKNKKYKHTQKRNARKENREKHKSNKNSTIRSNSYSQKLNKYNIDKNKLGLEKELQLQLHMSGGDTNDKNNKRRIKYMELFTLKHFQSQNKSIKLPKVSTIDNIIERVIASLYYGYSTNIACYSGTGKDYKVKFSSIEGTISGGMSKNSFDYIYPETNPDWVIYNKFTIQQEFGKLEKKGNLNLITILETKHLNYFFNLQEIMKKVMETVK